MPNTPTFGWPYPDANTAADVPFDIQQALLAVESTLKRPMWRGYSTSNQSKASGTTLGITITEEFAKGAAFTAGAASYVRTVPISGVYRITGQVTWAAAASGVRTLELKKNITGTDFATGEALARCQLTPDGGSGLITCHSTTLDDLVTGDTVCFGALQTSGAAVDVIGSRYQTFFELEWLGPL